jgi:DUF4097 and DUF4098 domain-containing protein YvlB
MLRTLDDPRSVPAALTLLLVAVVVAVGPALADQAIDETRKVSRNATITIKNLAGSVTVAGWNRSEVKITGTLDEKASELSIEGGEDQLMIEVRYPDRVKNVREGSRLVIQAPAGARLDIGTVSARVEADGIEGTLEIKTVSGDVTVRGKPAAVRAESVSGGLDVAAQADKVTLATVSGDIEAAGARRDLSCRSVSGAITADAGKDLATLSCETISGDLAVAGQLARKAEWELSAHSGDVRVELAGKVDARFRLKTFSGDIHDTFGREASRTSRYAPGRELSFTEGTGDALLKVDVFSGSVRVVQK